MTKIIARTSVTTMLFLYWTKQRLPLKLSNQQAAVINEYVTRHSAVGIRRSYRPQFCFVILVCGWGTAHTDHVDLDTLFF